MQTTPRTEFEIAVFPGDGIGHEIMPACLSLLAQACERVGGCTLAFTHWDAGARTWQTYGSALPTESLDGARKADAILLAAMGDPAIRYPDGTEITPQLDMRFELGLYAGLRPVRSIPGVPGPLTDKRAANIDFVLVRESIEGLFAPSCPGEIIDDVEARETLLITRAVSEKLFSKTFELAKQRHRSRRESTPGRLFHSDKAPRVTCVDKANVFKAFAFFRKLFDEEASRHALPVDHAYVDIMALNLVTRPWEYDVLVTENMFGDILSDLGAGLIGGMGYAPSADIGDEHAVFQPCHGSAPDIAGQGLANPTAMFLSGAMMLEWLGYQHQCVAATTASRLIETAVDDAFRGGDLRTTEVGGSAGLTDVTAAVEQALQRAPLPTGE